MAVGVAVAVPVSMAVAVDVAKGVICFVPTIRTHYRQGTLYYILNDWDLLYE